jgi:hypothetical protein
MAVPAPYGFPPGQEGLLGGGGGGGFTGPRVTKGGGGEEKREIKYKSDGKKQKCVKKWTPEEDQMMFVLVNELGTKQYIPPTHPPR